MPQVAEQQRTRGFDCVCGASFQQSAILVEGWTDGGGPVERREIWTPDCENCREIREESLRLTFTVPDSYPGHSTSGLADGRLVWHYLGAPPHAGTQP